MRFNYLSHMRYRSSKLLIIILAACTAFIVGCGSKPEEKQSPPAQQVEKPAPQKVVTPAELPVTQAQRYLSYQK